MPSQLDPPGSFAPHGMRHVLPRKWQTDKVWKTRVPVRRQLGHGVRLVFDGTGCVNGTTGLVWDDLGPLNPGRFLGDDMCCFF